MSSAARDGEHTAPAMVKSVKRAPARDDDGVGRGSGSPHFTIALDQIGIDRVQPELGSALDQRFQ